MFRRPYLCPSKGHKHDVAIQSFINLGKTFFLISRIWNIAQTWFLVRPFAYLSSFISLIRDFLYWMVCNFIFDCVTVKTENTLMRTLKIVFTVTQQQQKKIGNRPLEEAKKMKCYKRLIDKQFVKVSSLCGPQFLSYLPKRFMHLCRALHGDAILVYRFGPPIWPPEINKNIWCSLFL